MKNIGRGKNMLFKNQSFCCAVRRVMMIVGRKTFSDDRCRHGMPTYGLSFIYMPIIAVLCLSACCTPGVRPEDANIFQAACGISTGDFDRQVEAAQDEAQKSESMLETEKARSQRLEGELAVRKQERQRLEYQLARLIESTSEYEAQILAIRTETDDDLRQRENWLEQIARINAEMEHLQSQQSKLSIELFQQKIEALKQEIEVLRRISLEQ